MVARRIFHSFRYAAHGIAIVAKSEPTFQVQLVIAVLVCLAAVLLQVRLAETLLLVLVAASVLVLELLNSAVERLVDLLKPRLHDQVAVIKDIMAGAVLVAAIGAAIIGIAIFSPHLSSLFAEAARYG